MSDNSCDNSCDNSGINSGNNNVYTFESLSKLKKPELVSICKEKKLPVSGTKPELIDRILDKPKVPKTGFKSETKSESKTETKSTKKQPITVKPIQSKPIFKKIREQFTEEKKEPIIIKKNIHGHFEHLDTGLVFSLSKKVIGIQKSDGTIDNLSLKDIENVYKYHFELEKNIVVNDEINDSNQMLLSDELHQEKRLQELEEFTRNSEQD